MMKGWRRGSFRATRMTSWTIEVNWIIYGDSSAVGRALVVGNMMRCGEELTIGLLLGRSTYWEAWSSTSCAMT